jgi:tetratricopeptide (TPR) repeat protein
MKVASTKELNHVRELLFNDDVDQAIKELRRLCNLYPNDSVVYQQLGSVLLRQGKNISEALYILSLATNRYNKHAISYDIATYYLSQGEFFKAEEKFKTLLEGDDKFKCYGYLGLIRTYIHIEDYKAALTYFDKLAAKRELVDFDVSHYYNLKFYLYYKNGVELKNVHADNYFIRQLVDYSREAAIEHIKEHLKSAGSEGLETKRVHSIFEKETNIDILYDQCNELIKDINPNGYGTVDYYVCKLENQIGTTYSNKETANVEVVTFPNSKQILSIYPTDNNHVNKISNPVEGERKTLLRQKNKKKSYEYTKKNHN